MLKTGGNFHGPAIENEGRMFNYREKTKGKKGKTLGGEKR
jgi:hypothetical protein